MLKNSNKLYKKVKEKEKVEVKEKVKE